MTTRTFAGPFASAVLLFTVASARAECPPVTPRVDAFSPPDGAAGLPLNAAIAFGLTPRFAGYAPSVTLTRSSDAVQAPGALLSGPADSWLYVPDAPLVADQTYQVEIADASGAGAPESFAFSTGSASDVADPVVPTAPVLSIAGYTDPVREEGCLQPGYWVVQADWEDVAGEAAVLYALDVELEDLIPQELGDAAAPAAGFALVSAESERSFHAPEDSAVRVRVYAIDGAGRQGRSPEAVLRTPPAPGAGGAAGCGCDLHATGSPLSGKSVAAVLAAGLMAGMGLGRRRAFAGAQARQAARNTPAASAQQ